MDLRSTLGPSLFLIYINDLRYSLKFCSTSHFADDTCIIYANKKHETLETNINHDLNKLTEWLRANRLSLNVDKTKLIIFRSKYSKNNYEEISIKLQGIRLAPSKYVKYLGIYIDENLSWDIHIQKLSNKLS